MILSKKSLFITLIGCFLFWGCSSESTSKDENKREVVLGKIELSEAWARPGTKGQMSGVYLTISNGTASIDTLLSVSSDIAEKVELHESLEIEDGTISMRPAGSRAIEDGAELRLEPGGLHIMLMKLKRDLTVGDSLTVSLEFSHVGKKTISLPVKIQN